MFPIILICFIIFVVFSVIFANQFGKPRGIDILFVLRKEKSAIAIIYKSSNKPAEIFYVKHGSFIIYIRKKRRFQRDFFQRVIISPAPLAVNHRRSENGDCEIRRFRFLQRDFRLQFGFSVIRFRVRKSIGTDITAVQPVHAHRTEKNELFHAVVFRFRRAIRRQIAIHFVIQLRIFFGFFSMCYSGNVKNRIIATKRLFSPAPVYHINRIYFVLVGIFLFQISVE